LLGYADDPDVNIGQKRLTLSLRHEQRHFAVRILQVSARGIW
jgi:hypothetical protein